MGDAAARTTAWADAAHANTTAWADAAHANGFQHLLDFNLPKALLRVLFLLAQVPGCHDHLPQGVHAVEFFAGKHRICKAFRMKGAQSIPYDKYTIDNRMDMNSSVGFALALLLVLAVRPGGLIWMAPVCSSWVFINRSTSMRSALNPCGDRSLPHVADGNLQAPRVALLAWLAAARGCSWVLEQPRSSILWHHPRFQLLLHHLQVFRAPLCLGDFGAATEKPIYLWSSHAWIQEVRPRGRKAKAKHTTCQQRRDANGKLVVDGGRLLKSSQTYPRAFGQAVASALLTHMEPHGGGLLQPTPWRPSGAAFQATKNMLHMKPEDDPWEDAKLKDVEFFLHRGEGHGLLQQHMAERRQIGEEGQ